jgi:hypothetical protein
MDGLLHTTEEMHDMRTLTPLLATALLTTTLVGIGGCASDNYYDDRERYGYRDDGDGYYDDNGYYVVRRDVYYDHGPYYGGHYYGGPYYYSGGRRYYRDDYYRRNHDYHREARDRVRVPRDAGVVANGRGGLEYQADQPGRVYVRDEKTGKVIYRGRVQPGDEVKVAADAKGRRVSVNGETARGDLSAKPRDREVFFRPDRGTAPKAEAQAKTPAAARESAAPARGESRSAKSSRASSSDGDGDGGGRRK